jgi:ubiquinone/menaquinone biosynthesis C-methylase UbiE
MPNIAWNKAVWDRDYKWPLDGDEWTQGAEFCGVPYGKWKDSIARTFLIPYLRDTSVVVEIGPGHGRWTEMIVARVTKGAIHLVDISPSCLEFCRKRFVSDHMMCHVTDGQTLPEEFQRNSVDFAWSFDTFVHIEEPEIRSYARELHRVLKPQGMGVIHHAGNPTPEQRQNGARSQVGSKLLWHIFTDVGFFVIRQAAEWGDGCNMKLAGDAMTIFVKP